MQVEGKRLIKAGLAYVIGSFFSQGLRFITLPIFSRIMLPADYGYIASYELWISILTILVGLQTSATVVNAYIDYGERKIDRYTSSVSSLGFISFIICSIVTVAFSNRISSFLELNIKFLMAGIIQSLCFYYINMLTSKYRVIDNVRGFLAFNIGHTSLSILISFIFVINFSIDKYAGYILGFFASQLLVGLIAGILIYLKGKCILEKNMNLYAIKLSYPLILHSAASVISSKLNQLLLLKMIDATNAGIYNFTNNFALIITGLYTAFNNAYVPWYFRQLHAGNKKEVEVGSKTYISIFTFCVSCIIMIMPETIMIMGSKEYHFAINIVPILILSTYINFLYTFCVNYEFYNKKTIYIAAGTLLAAFCNVLLNVILIKYKGIIGATIATCLAASILMAFHYVITKKVIKGFELNFNIFLQNIIFVSIIVLMYYYLINRMLIRFAIIAIMIIFLGYKGLKAFRGFTNKNR